MKDFHTYPMNGLAVYTIIGPESCSFENMSPTVPPATERKALPASPLKNRPTSIVAILRASAHGKRNKLKKEKDTI